MAYGNRLRQIRIDKEMTLRELSLRTDLDTAYLSRIERETIKPPQAIDILDSINAALDLDQLQSIELKDLAALDNQKFPDDIAEQVHLEGFPVLLRTVANKRLNGDKLKELIKFINEQY